MSRLIIADKCHVDITQFCGCATVAAAVMQASLCKGNTAVTRLRAVKILIMFFEVMTLLY
jgi:hypothetical protein